MGKIKIHKGRPVWVQTPGEQFDEMIKDKFIEFITGPGHLSHNDLLFRAWLVEHIPTRKRTISEQVKEKCLQFLRDKRQAQFVESHAKEMEELFEAIGYKNV
jgi:hemerythrin